MIKQFLIILLLFQSSINANFINQNKIALLIGNNDYQEHTKLKNPINDVNLLTKTLKKRGFKVTKVTDANKEKMKKELTKFSKSLDSDTVALFYYAGHGVEVDGKNYLLGIDSKIDEYDEVKYSALSLKQVTNSMKESKNNINIIILDACRDNPFNKYKKGGLAPYTNTPGFFVAYATQAGEVASDGDVGENGLFTKYLVKNMQIENLDIEGVFKNTRADVYVQSIGKQHPTTYSSILNNFYFTNSIEHQSRALKVSITNQKKFLKRHKRYIEPNMVFIKKGTFIKGDDKEFETSPTHQVTIDKDFYISTHEVTFDEFDLFSKDTGWNSPSDNGWGRGMQPVINVSWNDANKYCEWLSKKTNKHYKLPTESQWEYVVKENKNLQYGVSDDDTVLANYSWYDDNSKKHSYEVGKKEPNKYGIYDILGNVQEWMEDDFSYYSSSKYKKSYKNGKAITIENSFEKVVKGGSWYSQYNELKVSNRVSLDKESKNSYTGFRIIRID